MGNYQFGFNKPPDFIGKGWILLKERRKSNNERKSKLTRTYTEIPSKVQRSVNRASSFRFYSNTDKEFQEEEPPPWEAHSGTSNPHGRNRCSVRRTRSMRSSPTVPDSVTLTLEMVNTAVGGGGIAAAAAGSTSSDAVATALNALHKLTPAAPNMFKEPSFDDFFEEAERRHETIKALQAALGARSRSATSITANRPASSNVETTASATMERAASYGSSFINYDTNTIPAPETDTHLRASPIIVQPPTPPRTRKLSPAWRKESNKETIWTGQDDAWSEIRCADDSLMDHREDTTLSPPHSSKGRVLVIVGGCSDAESSDTDRWDRPPPTIIVQPDPTGERLFCPVASSVQCSVHQSTVPASSNAMGASKLDSRRKISPSSIPPPLNANVSVRFADELVNPGPAVIQYETRENRNESNRAKRRSSLRRKTIGIVTNLTDERNRKMETGPLGTAGPLFPAGNHQQRRQITKKCFSRPELYHSQPIIRLLTQPQIILIRHLWQQIYTSRGPTVLGSHIFHRVMFKNPQIREVFRVVDIGNQCFNVDFMCKKHARSVATTLDEVVRNLENLEALESKLMDIGRLHAVFHDLGFKTNFWSVFAEAFIDCTLEWGEKNRRVEEARKAWAIIISYVTDKLKLGYKEGRRNSPRCPSARRIRVVSEIEIRDPDTVPKLPLIRSDSS